MARAGAPAPPASHGGEVGGGARASADEKAKSAKATTRRSPRAKRAAAPTSAKAAARTRSPAVRPRSLASAGAATSTRRRPLASTMTWRAPGTAGGASVKRVPATTPARSAGPPGVTAMMRSPETRRPHVPRSGRSSAAAQTTNAAAMPYPHTSARSERDIVPPREPVRGRGMHSGGPRTPCQAGSKFRSRRPCGVPMTRAKGEERRNRSSPRPGRSPMLVLTRKLGENIRIGDVIKITVLEVRSGQVKLGIDAPPEVKVHREEIYARIQAENRRAAQTSPDALREAARDLPWPANDSGPKDPSRP